MPIAIAHSLTTITFIPTILIQRPSCVVRPGLILPDPVLHLVTTTPPHTNLKLHAVSYDTLPPSTEIMDYAIGLEKLSANGQFFVVAQMAVCL